MRRPVGRRARGVVLTIGTAAPCTSAASAGSSETRSGSQLLIRADGRMYQHKTARRAAASVVRAIA
jgi:hypothetical protein